VIGGASAAAGAFTTLNTSGAVVFNDAGADVDFRVEGDGDANLLFVDASADAVGIGTSSPSAKLHVSGADIKLDGGVTATLNLNGSAYGMVSADADLYVETAGAGNQVIFRRGGTESMRIDSSGNLGIGATSPTTKLDVFQDQNAASNLRIRNNDSGSSAYAGVVVNASGNSWGMRMGSSAANSNALEFVLDALGTPSVKATIDSSGNLLVAKTSFSGTSGVGTIVGTDGRINVVTAATTSAFSTYELYSTGAGYRFYVDASGTVNATSIVISAISDQRLKENVRDIDTGLDEIMALQPRRFDWKEGKGQDKKNVAGFIAQEFETVFPECVATSKAGEDGIEYKNINHETLIPTLVKAIQELKAELDTVKAELATLKGN
jgi:hypothetical protein